MCHTPADIPIGRPVACELLEAILGYGVYKCTVIATGEIAYVVARMPNIKEEREYRPASAVHPFETAEKAAAALTRWASGPPLPPLPRPPRPLGGRRNGNRPKQPSDAVDQLMLDL